MDEKYISVTKFKETLAKLTVEGGTEATRTTIARTLGEVVPKLLDDEPFADVQPVKHGRWIEVTPKHSRCSVCDTTCLIAVYPISKGANFCPNCGARMDGGENG